MGCRNERHFRAIGPYNGAVDHGGRATCRTLAAVLVLLATTLFTGCGLFEPGQDRVAREFAAAWSGGDDRTAAALTDSPAAAEQALAAVRAALRPAGLAVAVDQVRTASGRADASVTVTWDLGKDRRWSYPSALALREADSGWLVEWSPAAVHPGLGPGQSLVLTEQAPDPAPVLDRDGAPLLSAQPVVVVLLDTGANSTAADLPAVAEALARALSRFDPTITQQSIIQGAGATPGQAYQVAVLREADYRQVQAAIHELPGVTFSTQTRLLAPDAGFARQVLTGVRVGLADQLDGVPGWTVRTVGADGAAVADLEQQPPRPGTAVTVTIDRAVQAAAEDAVDPIGQQAMLVAVRPSTGELLAVAQNSPADAEGPVALTGRYPPGSTAKIVTADAALTRGLSPSSPVGCPATVTIGGREVPNNDRLDLGTVPLVTAFARSCNTTFAQLAADGGAGDLSAAARRLGLGADYVVPGATTVTGSVPPADDVVRRAANGFGQGDVLASPLGMALVAATVDRGAPVTPQLVKDRPTAVSVPPDAPQPPVIDALRTMMRQVVVAGTASRLASLGEVSGKTGTAQVGAGDRAHGWFVGYRGDLAFAVLLVDAGSSQPAVEVAARFLGAVS